MEPEKPFACTMPECGMTFTNEDHLHVHTKKHDMVLQLGMEQKAAAFVADQTPTPTRFIRNCEEVGLFQDLQNVNPFDEGFKRAMEAKHGNLPLENGAATDDVLHTPHMFPAIDSGDCTLYSATNNQRNITISRSSSDESGAVQEYETTTISKLTNEVTTISRVVGKQDHHDRVTTTDDVSIVRHEETARNKGVTTASYTNNVIKIHSNVEIRKDQMKEPKLECVKDKSVKDAPPIMSQKSLDLVIDSLTSDPNVEDVKNLKRNYDVIKEKPKEDNYEVIIKLPNGKQVKMKSIDDDKTIEPDTREKLKQVITNKTNPKVNPTPQLLPNILPITTGTLIPVTFVPAILTKPLPKPIPKLPIQPGQNFKMIKKEVSTKEKHRREESEKYNCVRGLGKEDYKLSRSAASKRYRERLRQSMRRQSDENKELREINRQLVAERSLLKLIITEHLKKCPMGEDLKYIQEKLTKAAECFQGAAFE